jgi:hypothetical protein
MYDTGKHAGEGLPGGLKAHREGSQKQIDKLAKDLVAQIKKVLKIKSPSVVFRDEVGKNVVLGMVHGMDMHVRTSSAAPPSGWPTPQRASTAPPYVPSAAGSAAPVRTLLWDRLSPPRWSGQANGRYRGHVHFDDDAQGPDPWPVKPLIKASSDGYRLTGPRWGGRSMTISYVTTGAQSTHTDTITPAVVGIGRAARRPPGGLRAPERLGAVHAVRVDPGGQHLGRRRLLRASAGPRRLTFFVRQSSPGATPTRRPRSRRGRPGRSSSPGSSACPKTAGTGWRWAATFGDDQTAARLLGRRHDGAHLEGRRLRPDRVRRRLQT